MKGSGTEKKGNTLGSRHGKLTLPKRLYMIISVTCCLRGLAKPCCLSLNAESLHTPRAVNLVNGWPVKNTEVDAHL